MFQIRKKLIDILLNFQAEYNTIYQSFRTLVCGWRIGSSRNIVIHIQRRISSRKLKLQNKKSSTVKSNVKNTLLRILICVIINAECLYILCLIANRYIYIYICVCVCMCAYVRVLLWMCMINHMLHFNLTIRIELCRWGNISAGQMTRLIK